MFYSCGTYLGVAFGPRHTLILHKALSAWPVSAAVANAGWRVTCPRRLTRSTLRWTTLSSLR
jgi:hypothetical protein